MEIFFFFAYLSISLFFIPSFSLFSPSFLLTPFLSPFHSHVSDFFLSSHQRLLSPSPPSMTFSLHSSFFCCSFSSSSMTSFLQLCYFPPSTFIPPIFPHLSFLTFLFLPLLSQTLSQSISSLLSSVHPSTFFLSFFSRPSPFPIFLSISFIIFFADHVSPFH